MAAITVFEFFLSPGIAGETTSPTAYGELLWPADVVTRTTSGAGTHTLNDATKAIVVTADGNCRMRFNKPGDTTDAAGSDMPIISAAPNPFLITRRPGNTLRFL